MPACAFIISAARCGELPLPGEPNDALAGVGLEVGEQALEVLDRDCRRAPPGNTSTRAAEATGTRSFAGSNDIFGVDVRVDRHHAARTHQQRVAVGRRLGHHVAAQVAARAALVLDHHGLAERFLQRRADGARDLVGRAAGREVDDDLDRLARPVLGLAEAARAETPEQRQRRDLQERFHGRSFADRSERIVALGGLHA